MSSESQHATTPEGRPSSRSREGAPCSLVRPPTHGPTRTTRCRPSSAWVPFRVRESTSAAWNTFDAAVVKPDAPHQLDAGGAPIALVYLDPESAEGRAAVARLARPGIQHLEGAHFDEFRAHALALWRGYLEVRSDLMTSVVDALVGSCVLPAPLDPRVRKALDLFESLPGRRTSLPLVAAAVSLSPGRFAHLFREQTGLAVRRYLLWLRLRDAVQEVAIGRTLTEATHATRFSDSAHLTRTFREMFGVVPSAAFKNCRFVRVVGP
jgi:AraC family transcriptional regulator